MSRSYKAFKKNIIDSYLNNFGNQYFFMGYSPNSPDDNSIDAERDARSSASFAYVLFGNVSGKKTNVAKVVKRYDWTSGTIYEIYDSSTNLKNKVYYVKNSQDNVYVCLENKPYGESSSNNVSSIEPTGRSSSPTTLADGYTWKYLYTIDGELSDFLKTINGVDYMPVKRTSTTEIRSDATGTASSQYRSEKGKSGKVIRASIDLSETITFDTDSPTIEVIGDGDKVASVNLVVNKGVVSGIVVNNGGSGYNFANIKVQTTPTSHTSEEVENKIKLIMSPENRTIQRQDSDSYFYVDKLMYNIIISADDIQPLMRQRVFNVYGIAKDFMLAGNYNKVAGSETISNVRNGYRISQKFTIKGYAESKEPASGYNVIEYSGANQTAYVGGEIKGYSNDGVTGIVTYFGKPAGYTGETRADLEVSFYSGTGGFKNTNSVNTKMVSGSWTTDKFWIDYSDPGFDDSQIKKNTGETLYINYLDEDLVISNTQAANLIFLQEI
jgi:hypothetical protein